jgi:hypothetical protein
MSILQVFSTIKNWFSPYVNPFERELAEFFTKIKESSSVELVRAKATAFLQRDLVMTLVYLESRFKRYTHLGKKARTAIYRDRELLRADFENFIDQHPLRKEQIAEQMLVLGLTEQELDADKLGYMMQIMAYLKPDGRYLYRTASSFDSLIVDPRKAKLVGDCNQIVSLYAYFYALKYPITDLKVKLLPEHICLQFFGVDLEAVEAKFHVYDEFEYVAELYELISVNLLDVRDYTRSFFRISDYNFLICARLALLLSSNRKATEHNISVAYYNLGVKASQKDDFTSAIHFFKLSKNQEALNNAYRNAAIHYLNLSKLTKAKSYARMANDADLLKQIDKKAAYLEYQKLWLKVQKLDTEAKRKKHKSTYSQMLKLAVTMEDEKAITQLKQILGNL